MGDAVIVAYRPHAGKADELLDLVMDHAPALRRMGLATDHPATVLRAADGTLVEVFEWAEGAIDRAHDDPGVLAMWGQFGAVCDYLPLRDLAECADLFAQFVPVAVT